MPVEDRIGVKIAFSERYADPDHKRWLKDLIKQRHALRADLTTMLRAKGWPSSRIEKYVKKALNSSFDLAHFQKAMQLSGGDPLNLNAVTYCTGVSGRLVHPVRWFVIVPGRTVWDKSVRKLVQRGPRLYRSDAFAFFKSLGHRESIVNVWAEIDYVEDGSVTPFGCRIQICKA